MENENRIVTKGEIFKYAFGGIGSNIPFMLVLTYLMFFYTDMAGISPALVGTLFFISRFIDAVTDPIMGMIADRTKSRLGKYRPWLILSAPLVGFSLVMLFWIPDLPDTQKIVYIYTTYIFYSIVTTVANIPYHSLTAVMSQDPHQRTSLASAKQFMSIPSILVAQSLFLPIVGIFGGGEQGWLLTAILFGVIVTTCFWICASSAKRHDTPYVEIPNAPKEDYSFKEQLKLLAKNKPLIILSIAMCTNLFAFAIQSSVQLYYWTHVIGRQELFPILSLVGTLLSIPFYIFLPYLSKKFEKKGIFLYGSIISIVPFLVLLFTPGEFVGINFTAAVIATMLGPTTGAICWAMLPDCVEYGEWKTGIRGAGVVTSSLTFVNKLAQAGGGLLAGVLLGSAGYVAGQTQSPGTLNMIVYLYTIIPILGHIATILVLRWYKIDTKFYLRIVEEIKQRKAQKLDNKIV